MHCKLIGIPLQNGASQKGCEMGPSALRVAGLAEALRDLGHEVTDLGNIAPPEPLELSHPNGVLRHLGEISEWTRKADGGSLKHPLASPASFYRQ